jgi:hypothetical protein
MMNETTYQRLMKEAKEQYDREMAERKTKRVKMKVREVLDHLGLKGN